MIQSHAQNKWWAEISSSRFPPKTNRYIRIPSPGRSHHLTGSLGKIVVVGSLTCSVAKWAITYCQHVNQSACRVVTFSHWDARRFKNQCAAQDLRKAPLKPIQLRYQPKIVTSASHTVQRRRSLEAGVSSNKLADLCSETYINRSADSSFFSRLEESKLAYYKCAWVTGALVRQRRVKQAAREPADETLTVDDAKLIISVYTDISWTCEFCFV